MHASKRNSALLSARQSSSYRCKHAKETSSKTQEINRLSSERVVVRRLARGPRRLRGNRRGIRGCGQGEPIWPDGVGVLLRLCWLDVDQMALRRALLAQNLLAQTRAWVPRKTGQLVLLDWLARFGGRARDTRNRRVDRPARYSFVGGEVGQKRRRAMAAARGRDRVSLRILVRAEHLQFLHLLVMQRLFSVADLHELDRFALDGAALGVGLWASARAMTKELLPKSNHPPAPVGLGVEPLRGRPLLCAFRALLTSPTTPAAQNEEEDERAAECHEQDLPPLKLARSR